MSDVIDPGKGARRQARKQAELLRKEKQKQLLEKAEIDDELAKKKALVMNPAKNRQRMSLLSSGRKQSLG